MALNFPAVVIRMSLYLLVQSVPFTWGDLFPALRRTEESLVVLLIQAVS